MNSSHTSYEGNYVGIVIQNNDPDKAGKVKVFVPHISPSVYKNWNEIPENKKIAFLGKNVDSDLSSILSDLKLILPWAVVMTPVSGGDSIALYNARSDSSTISDSIDRNSNLALSSQLGNPERLQNALSSSNVCDGFVNSINTGFVNASSFGYNIENYSNSAKGDFSIPNVGSKVIVVFDGGNPLYPIIIGSIKSAVEWQSIYGEDYPGDYENAGNEIDPNNNFNNTLYSGKKVINQKAGSIVFVNTDNREKLKFIHKSGSFIELGNDTNVEFNKFDKQTLTQGTNKNTIIGDDYNSINGNKSSITKGNNIETVGLGVNVETLFNDWKLLLKPIQDKKQLFEIKRAAKIDSKIQLNSPLQTKSGSPEPCPVCSQGKTHITQNEIFQEYLNVNLIPSILSYPRSDSTGDTTDSSLSIIGLTPPAAPLAYPATNNCKTCDGSGFSPSSYNGNWIRENLKDSISTDFSNISKQLINIERQLGKGGSLIRNVTKDLLINVGTTINDFIPFRIDEEGKLLNSSINIDSKGVYENKHKYPLVEYVNPYSLPGGTLTINAANGLNIKSGSLGLNLKTVGNINVTGGITNIAAYQLNMSSKYEINIAGKSRLNLISDSLSFDSKNQILINQSTGINGNLTTKGSAYIGGELYVNHVSAPIEIQQTEKTKVFAKPLDAFKGECLPGTNKIGTVYLAFTVTSIDTGTAGAGIQSFTITSAQPVQNASPVVTVSSGAVGQTIVGMFDLWGDFSMDNSIACYDHAHNFANLPLNLYKQHDTMRADAVNSDKQLENTINQVSHSNKLKEAK